MCSDEPLTPFGDDGEYQVLLRQMALVDRVIGLEAEVARLEAAARESGGARAEIERLETALAAVYASRTWWVGRAFLGPVRVARLLKGRS
ncbi:hypothetical protein [Demequina lutea]|uniref:Uncharacterized small protein (DUF1192 family) n=1 Tax=Demequina lutea TaxID=431489 RepID=A0A7Y9ZEE9_9MICO|nr:hypothetical protein [Demequina lutea]NYI42460.1 uncharacterized small protein (DUF1192 family) [Demequina lutea]